MGLLKNFKQKWFSKRNQLEVQYSVYFFVFILALGLFVGFLGSILGITMDFMTERHNIDLTVNALNIKCDGCLEDLSDTGITSSGLIKKTGLKDVYIYALYNTKILFLAVVIVSFFAGALLMGIIETVTECTKAGEKLKRL